MTVEAAFTDAPVRWSVQVTDANGDASPEFFFDVIP
jgi:hypothetical protein